MELTKTIELTDSPRLSPLSVDTLSATAIADILRGCVQIMLQKAPRPDYFRLQYKLRQLCCFTTSCLPRNYYNLALHKGAREIIGKRVIWDYALIVIDGL